MQADAYAGFNGLYVAGRMSCFETAPFHGCGSLSRAKIFYHSHGFFMTA